MMTDRQYIAYWFLLRSVLRDDHSIINNQGDLDAVTVEADFLLEEGILKDEEDT